MGSYGVNRKTREAIVAGIFYPEDAEELSARVDSALQKASGSWKPERTVRPLAILSPHAAFDYSCDIQAAAWSEAAVGRVDRVVIIAPLKKLDEPGAYLPESAIYQTPLGDIAVDCGACADLESCSMLFTTNDIPHFESHAIEVQLPFMRTLFPDALLVPVLVCGDASVASSMARAIDVVFGDDMDRTLVVVSSNLASSLVAADAAQRSDDVVRIMKTESWRELAERRDIAGSAAIASAMAIQSMEDARFRLLARIDSMALKASVSERVVHYAAGAWYPGGES